MQISASRIKRISLVYPLLATLVAASSLPAAAAAAATDPLPSPTTACSSLTVANLQASIDALNADINGPATQDVSSVPSASVVPGATLYVAQYEHDDLVSARDMLVKLRDTLVVPSLAPGQSFVTNASVAYSVHDTVWSAIDQVQTAEHYAMLSAVYNKTLAPRYSYLAMVQLMPALAKLGADGGACYVSQYRPVA
jgi:hypothetical protein